MTQLITSEYVMFTSILAGYPLEGIKNSLSLMPSNNSFRIKCEMVVALRERRPQDVLMKTKGLEKSASYFEFLPLIECARVHANVADTLFKLGILPPQFVPLCFKNDTIDAAQNISSGDNMNALSTDTRRKLSMFLDSKKGEKISKKELDAVSARYGLTTQKVKAYFKHLKRYRKIKNQRQINKSFKMEKKKSEDPDASKTCVVLFEHSSGMEESQ